jgi:hypothetical protein
MAEEVIINLGAGHRHELYYLHELYYWLRIVLAQFEKRSKCFNS